MARRADELRRRGRVLGPLHGIPVLLKGNIDTGDRMQTTAGSFGLKGAPAPRDSTVAARLRAGGAVILGKTNLSEWANFRSFNSSSGWSAVGGQTHNPYGLNRNPCGSSSGSGAAASREFRGGLAGHGNGRQHRVSRQREWCRGPQAHRGSDQPGRRGTDLAHPGHGGAAWPHRRRRGDRVVRHSEPHLRWARPRDGRRAARLDRTPAAHEHSRGLHPVPGSQRPARCASRAHAFRHRERTGAGRRGIRRGARGSSRPRARRSSTWMPPDSQFAPADGEFLVLRLRVPHRCGQLFRHPRPRAARGRDARGRDRVQRSQCRPGDAVLRAGDLRAVELAGTRTRTIRSRPSAA